MTSKRIIRACGRAAPRASAALLVALCALGAFATASPALAQPALRPSSIEMGVETAGPVGGPMRAPARPVSISADPFSQLASQPHARAVAANAAVRVERYVIASDNRAFLFENRGDEARLKFLCAEGDPRLDCRLDPERTAEEIHIVEPVTAPRGDVVFKDRSGRIYLRLASYGGATVFWPGDAAGHAASRSFGDETSLRLPFADVGVAHRRAQQATALVSAIAGAPVVFEIVAPGLDEAAAASVLADAVARAAKGVQLVADDPVGAKAIGRGLSRVRLVAAAEPELSFDGDVLEVRYNPAGDIDGRPSSAAIMRFLEDSL